MGRHSRCAFTNDDLCDGTQAFTVAFNGSNRDTFLDRSDSISRVAIRLSFGGRPQWLSLAICHRMAAERANRFRKSAVQRLHELPAQRISPRRLVDRSDLQR